MFKTLNSIGVETAGKTTPNGVESGLGMFNLALELRNNHRSESQLIVDNAELISHMKTPNFDSQRNFHLVKTPLQGQDNGRTYLNDDMAKAKMDFKPSLLLSLLSFSQLSLSFLSFLSLLYLLLYSMLSRIVSPQIIVQVYSTISPFVTPLIMVQVYSILSPFFTPQIMVQVYSILSCIVSPQIIVQVYSTISPFVTPQIMV